MSYEAELVALAVLLFLYDSTVLLYANEVVLSCNRKGQWQVSTGLQGFVIGGRRVCFLSPLALGRPSVRLRWDLYADSPAASGDTLWSEALPRLSLMSPWTLGAGVGLFVLLPLGLFSPLGVLAVVPALVLIYGAILVALVLIRWRGCSPALSGARFAGLVFECLACPPFGVNLVRHCSLMVRVEESLMTAAERLLGQVQLKVLGMHCQAVLDEELQQAGEDSPHRGALVQRRAKFEAWIQSV